eukprot:1030825-Prorocentrum_minimum.AAC.1
MSASTNYINTTPKLRAGSSRCPLYIRLLYIYQFFVCSTIHHPATVARHRGRRSVSTRRRDSSARRGC